MNVSSSVRLGCQAFALTTAVVMGAALPRSAQPYRNAAPGDQQFVSNMLQEAREQIALARLAEKRAADPVTASAAREAIQEWSAIRANLVGIAYNQADPVRGRLDPPQQMTLDQLGSTPPARFDRAYLRDAERGDRLALGWMSGDVATTDGALRGFIDNQRGIVSSYEQMDADDLRQSG